MVSGWWRRVDGVPGWFVERQRREFSKAEVAIWRLGSLAVVIVAWVAALTGVRGLLVFVFTPVLSLLSMAPAQRRQMLERTPRRQ
jgi:hypothetical protein